MSEKGESTRPLLEGAILHPDSGKDVTSPPQTEGEHSRMLGLFSRLGIKTMEERRHENIATGTELMVQRWGPPDSSLFEMVMRYWIATRMQQHWEHLQAHHPKKFRQYMEKGYMEPIPTSWVQSGHLALRYSLVSIYNTQAEARLNYLLKNWVAADGTKPLEQSPEHRSIPGVELADGEDRKKRLVQLDAGKLAKYKSPGDVFYSDKQTKSWDYSAQVPHAFCAAREAALFELAEGIRKGTDDLETMLLIDVSDSMTWNPHQGIEEQVNYVGLSGTERPVNVVKCYDQPSNICLVEHLVHRVLQHMIPRAQKEHPSRQGICTATFSRAGRYLGPLSASGFQGEWASQIRLGGPARLMQGWQVVKNTYFDRQHRNGHGRLDSEFGWQATPGMPKLSLLVFLGGKADDMDEFQLELLGVDWAYVTIALVGMENCPHHHAYAAALERVAQSNPRVGIYEMQGRVCERMVVEDLLSSVYPVDPPQESEILKREFDLPWEGEAWIKPIASPVDPPQYSEIKEFDLPPREELPKYSASQGRKCADK